MMQEWDETRCWYGCVSRGNSGYPLLPPGEEGIC